MFGGAGTHLRTYRNSSSRRFHCEHAASIDQKRPMRIDITRIAVAKSPAGRAPFQRAGLLIPKPIPNHQHTHSAIPRRRSIAGKRANGRRT